MIGYHNKKNNKLFFFKKNIVNNIDLSILFIVRWQLP